MAIYTRPESAHWYYEFCVSGQRYRGSTRTADKEAARAYEQSARARVIREAEQAEAERRDDFRALLVWDAAQAWLAHSAKYLRDHRGNLTRVRKLFGCEMRLLPSGSWVEIKSNRHGLPLTTQIRAVTPELLAELTLARAAEGATAGTIEREISLLRTIIAHANQARAQDAAEQTADSKTSHPSPSAAPSRSQLHR